MNFDEFNNIMKDLERKNYVMILSHKDHVFVYVKEQNDDKLRNIIKENIREIWEKVDEQGYYGVFRYEFMFMRTSTITKILQEQDNYDSIINHLIKEDISYLKPLNKGKGVDRYISLDKRNRHGVSVHYGESHDFWSDISTGVRQAIPDNVTLSKCGYLRSEKAKEWEEKRINCQEIKIYEDFEKILNNYE